MTRPVSSCDCRPEIEIKLREVDKREKHKQNSASGEPCYIEINKKIKNTMVDKIWYNMEELIGGSEERVLIETYWNVKYNNLLLWSKPISY